MSFLVIRRGTTSVVVDVGTDGGASETGGRLIGETVPTVAGPLASTVSGCYREWKFPAAMMSPAAFETLRALLALDAQCLVSGDALGTSAGLKCRVRMTGAPFVSDLVTPTKAKRRAALTVRSLERNKPVPCIAGCGVVLPSPHDDNFNCGDVIDLAGARFPGAVPWSVLYLPWFEPPAGTFTPVPPPTAWCQLALSAVTSPFAHHVAGVIQAMPAGDCGFETHVDMDPMDFNEGAGIFFGETATNRGAFLYIGQDFTGPGGSLDLNAAVRVHSLTDPFDAVSRFARTVIPKYGATVRVARVGALLSFGFALDNEDGSVGAFNTIYVTAETTHFTTGPDVVGLFEVSPAPLGEVNTAYFNSFKQVA